MNYRDAIKKINKLLKLELFNSYKSKTGEEIIVDGSLEVGNPIYSVTENGQLPLSDGTYELEDSTQIKVEKGNIQEIKYDVMETKQEMTEAMLKDGTVVKSPTFDVGESISVVSPSGEEAPAPDGEHEVMLKDSEGKEVLIKVISKDGKIVERENVELSPKSEKEVEVNMGDMVPDLTDANAGEEDFKTIILKKIDEVMKKLEKMGEDYEDMKKKVNKFSKEPAGEPIKQPKNIGQSLNEHRNELFSQLLDVRRSVLKNK